ncbi:MAG: PduL/EutD family phosphate acyltransferase [Bacilli bacterium]
MEKDVSIGISARHVHLDEETYYKLFDTDLTVKSYLNQVGQFAANETLTLKTENGSFESVRIIGPLRPYNQIEISRSDARTLKINPPVRRSGDVFNSETVTLKTNKDEVTIEGCIIADRHVHMTPVFAKSLGVVDNQLLKLNISGIKSGVLDVYAKVSDDGYFEVHLDTDDANAFLINSGDIEKLII